MSELRSLTERYENPFGAIMDDLLVGHRGLFKPKLFCLRVLSAYRDQGGDTGDEHVNRYTLLGLESECKRKFKRHGYYDRSEQAFRTYLGSNVRQLRLGADYKIQKGMEAIGTGRTQHRLADMLEASSQETVDEGLLANWQQSPDAEEGASA